MKVLNNPPAYRLPMLLAFGARVFVPTLKGRKIERPNSAPRLRSRGGAGLKKHQDGKAHETQDD